MLRFAASADKLASFMSASGDQGDTRVNTRIVRRIVMCVGGTRETQRHARAPHRFF
jgi:hypothetical protein